MKRPNSAVLPLKHVLFYCGQCTNGHFLPTANSGPPMLHDRALRAASARFGTGGQFYAQLHLSGWPLGHHRRFYNELPSLVAILRFPKYAVPFKASTLFAVVFPPFPLSTSTSPSLYCSKEDSFSQSRWSCDVSVTLQFASFHWSQEVFMRPDGVSNSGFHFLIDYVISVRDTEEFAETSHPQCLYPSFNVCCCSPRFTCIQKYGHDQRTRQPDVGAHGDVLVVPNDF